MKTGAEATIMQENGVKLDGPVRGRPIGSVPDGWITGVAISRDEKSVAAACGDETVKLWELASGRLLWSTPRMKSPPSAIAIAFAADGTSIISGHWDGTWSVWEARSGRLLRSAKGHRENVTCVAISHDGKQFATSSDDRTVRVWDSRTGQVEHVLSGHSAAVTCVVFSVDGRRIVSGSKSELKSWELR